MHTVFSVVVVVVYVIVLTFVAVRARAAREFREFSLARRALPLALMFGSLAATYVGPVFSIGFVGRGFHSGFLFLVIGLAYSAQNILVGLLVAPRLRALKNCHTLGDAIGQKYNRDCQVLAGLISVGLCAGFAAVMAKAGGDVLRDIFGLPHWSSVVVVVGITTLYTTFGGLRASVITDAFQFSAFSILLPVTLLFILLFHLNGGAAAFAKEASAATSNGFGAASCIEIVGLVTAFLLGETLIPPYANRALASRTTRISRNGFILAGVFSITWFMVMVALGISARSIIPEGTGEDYVLLTLVKSVMPAEGYALLLVVVVSIVMSSLDSLLNAGAVAFTQDIVKPFAGIPDNTALNIGRAATIIIASIAAVGAAAVESIIDGLLICYTIWAPAILPALIIGLWVKQPRPLAGILSMGVGTLVAVCFQFIFTSLTKVPAIIPALGAALLAYVVGHWIEIIRERKRCR
ncbi:MAG: sodium:solute symporter family protein [Sedimentisphaerales bacterium]|nr:sodium:solute symporter family protein [Sedimentisphaerales bacterium]